MTSEFKEPFSKSPSQNDSSTHDSLKLMPNLNAIPEHLPVHLFSFSLLVPSRITLKFTLQRSLLWRNIFNIGLKSEHVNILDAIYERDTWLDLLTYFVHMHRHNHVFVYKLIQWNPAIRPPPLIFLSENPVNPTTPLLRPTTTFGSPESLFSL